MLFSIWRMTMARWEGPLAKVLAVAGEAVAEAVAAPGYLYRAEAEVPACLSQAGEAVAALGYLYRLAGSCWMAEVDPYS